MCGGFVQLHRKFLEWEWYDDHNTKMVFLHLLLKANYKPKKWRGEEIKRGQFVTSINTLSNELQLSVQQVRTCLTKLESTGEINKQSTSKLTKITICKYDSYQSFENDSNKQITNEQQSSNKQITNEQQQHNKEIKKERNNIDNIESGGDKSPTHPAKKKVVKTISDREQEFRSLLWGIVKEKRSQYQDEKAELKKFFDYWTECSPKGKKMKFEKQKTFDPAKRLDTWFANKRERETPNNDTPKGMDNGTFFRNSGDRSQFEGEGLRARIKRP